MKKYIILPLLFVSALCWGQAQFIVQNGSKTEVYKDINDAITNAVAGDTLYIPGGGYALLNNTITKQLHWVGPGHYPDSTTATYSSRITGDLYFNQTTSGSTFEGIYFTNQLFFGNDATTNNITFKRCRIGSNLYLLKAFDSNKPNLNFTISECVVNGILQANGGSNCTVENSLIFSTINNFDQSAFSHNGINVNAGYNGVLYQCSSSTFSNNTFSYEYGASTCSSCTFKNNLFPGVEPSSPGATYDANIQSVGNDIYVTITGNYYTFSYDNDYHLTNNWLSSDGVTPVGIYGSTTPYKQVPYYPHINSASIANEVVNDKLGVNINVQAQGR